MSEYMKNKGVIFIIWLAVIGMIVWIIAGTGDFGEKDISVNKETYTIASTENASDTEMSSETVPGYFTVKTVDNTVKVFWNDESGQHLYKETSIPVNLLSDEDQNMLESGVKIESEEELASFLENYDS